VRELAANNEVELYKVSGEHPPADLRLFTAAPRDYPSLPRVAFERHRRTLMDRT